MKGSLGGDQMANNTHPVTLPAAAEHAAHDFGDQFVFSTTNALGPNSASQPLDLVPEQAAPHVPEEVPPGLPSEALDNISDTALAQLHDQVDWLVS
jgi:hypothetical protein